MCCPLSHELSHKHALHPSSFLILQVGSISHNNIDAVLLELCRITNPAINNCSGKDGDSGKGNHLLFLAALLVSILDGGSTTKVQEDELLEAKKVTLERYSDYLVRSTSRPCTDLFLSLSLAQRWLNDNNSKTESGESWDLVSVIEGLGIGSRGPSFASPCPLGPVLSAAISLVLKGSGDTDKASAQAAQQLLNREISAGKGNQATDLHQQGLSRSALHSLIFALEKHEVRISFFDRLSLALGTRLH